ncbi:heavy metal-binding domain-containing protein [Hymenobacter metallicola]|uniref:Heavy metal binding domain-containing protein n=1 Tax=Hymenobacter metallicola TaxID=2563114 RepID=A0A4Z0QKQ7_9BACT|nr:heavy metal-binding domain-containing protein [Hymenobacter metallicola]TGE29312.1 hypothetical protein E5K02_07620 [Hymenobacter metallicola]
MKFTSLLLGSLLALSTLLSSCTEKPATGTTTAAPAATEAKASTTPVKEAVYECPMGCEGSRSAKPGKCPVCGMDLEKKS